MNACHHPIALHVIEPVGVELACHNGIVKGLRLFPSDQVRDIVGKAPTVSLIKNYSDLPGPNQPVADRFMASEGQIEDLTHSLKSMTEHPVANIVNQGSGQGKSCLGDVVVTPAAPQAALHRGEQLPRGVKHAEAVREAGVCGTRKHQLAEAELLYAT